MKRSGIDNILILKPGAIGDVLQLTPVIRALRNRFPKASISLLLGSSATAGLFRNHADVSETIVFDKRGPHRSCSSRLKLWRILRAKRFDLVIHFQRSNLKLWFLATAAFPCRVLTYHKSPKREMHAVVNYLETLAPLGIDSLDLDLELTPGEEERAFADKIVSDWKRENKPVIAFNPGASHAVNRWSIESFVSLADKLAESLSAGIIIIGGQEDSELAQKIASRTRSRPVVMAGKANLLQAAAVLERCDALISGDTGPMHMATAVGTTVIALFGAADPKRTGPVGTGHRILQARGVTCVPCRKRTCVNSRYLECMEKITTNDVYEAVRDIVQKRQK